MSARIRNPGIGATSMTARVIEPLTVEVFESAIDELSPTSVRVEVILCGICGSDAKMFRGGETLRPSLFGHEWVGRVAEVGPEVASVDVGARVVVSVPPPCGHCTACARGHGQYCLHTTAVVGGRDALAPTTGGFASLLTVPEYRVLTAHADLSDVQAGLVEPAAVALRGVRASKVELGARFVVQGGGPIGLLALLIAKAAGAGLAVVVEPVAERRELARSLGAEVAVAPEDAAEAVLDLSGGLGADLVLECSGKGDLIQRAVELSRRGGTIGLLGFSLGKASIAPATWIGREINLVATAGYSRAEQLLAMDLMAAGRVDAASLHSRTIGLGDLQETLSGMADGTSADVKVLVDPAQAGSVPVGDRP